MLSRRHTLFSSLVLGIALISLSGCGEGGGSGWGKDPPPVDGGPPGVGAPVGGGDGDGDGGDGDGGVGAPVGGGDGDGDGGDGDTEGIGPEGGTVESDDKLVSVVIPVGSLAQKTLITVAATPNAPSGNIGTAYEFGPSGTIFDPPATVLITYDESLLAGLDEATLQLATAVNDRWQPTAGATVDIANNIVTGTVSHFSIFGVIEDIPPVVSTTNPDNLTLANEASITVSGPIDDPTATVEVNGIPAVVSDGIFTATVPLNEGNNTLTVVATDPAGNTVTTTIRVTRDSTPPKVTIHSPADGAVINAPRVSVSGMINDIVVGTVNGAQAEVTVNGEIAQVANRSFLFADLALQPGPNTITVIGKDNAGNSSTESITVTFEDTPATPKIGLVSGNNQTGMSGSQLPEPLVVMLEDAAGNPVSGKTVIFEVKENNGALGGAVPRRAQAVTTTQQGTAAIDWTLGTRAGAGNNRVQATAVGFSGTAAFMATALPSTADKINVDGGNNQTGVAGQSLPRPLAVVVTDSGHNRLANVAVSFTVVEGGGSFDGESVIVLDTDSNGRALAVLTLGPAEGFDNNVVEATFAGIAGLPSRFVASGKIAGSPAETAIRGVVLDNTDQPIVGVTMRIEGTALTTQTDDQGQFVLRPAPVGHVFLIADGSTAQRTGTWPRLVYDLVTVSGRDNTIGMPIYLLPLDIARGLPVSETEGGTLTLPELPGFSLTVAPGSATFPDGSKSGTVSVTLVHADKVPMPPTAGQQPQMVVTIQPAGVHFDPRAPVTFPNVEGDRPGTVKELFSFDHDLGQFVSIGTGTVSNDGTVIGSDPGVGIIKGGWHHPPADAKTGGAENVKLEIVSKCQSPCELFVPTEPIVLFAGGFGVTLTAKGTPTPGEYRWRIAVPAVLSCTDCDTGPEQTFRGKVPGTAQIRVQYVSKSGAGSDIKRIDVHVVDPTLVVWDRSNPQTFQTHPPGGEFPIGEPESAVVDLGIALVTNFPGDVPDAVIDKARWRLGADSGAVLKGRFRKRTEDDITPNGIGTSALIAELNNLPSIPLTNFLAQGLRRSFVTAGFSEDFAGEVRAIVIHVIKAELEVERKGEVGGDPVIAVNNDFDEGKADDDSNPVADNADASPVKADKSALELDDLLNLSATFLPDSDEAILGSTVTLSQTGGKGAVRILATKPGGKGTEDWVEVPLGENLATDYFLAKGKFHSFNFKVEGITPGDVALELKLANGSAAVTDTANIKVFDADLLIGAEKETNTGTSDDWVGANGHTILNFVKFKGPPNATIKVALDFEAKIEPAFDEEDEDQQSRGTITIDPSDPSVTTNSSGVGTKTFKISGGTRSDFTEDINVRAKIGDVVVAEETLTVIEFNFVETTDGKGAVPLNPAVVNTTEHLVGGNLFGPTALTPGTPQTHRAVSDGPLSKPNLTGSPKFGTVRADGVEGDKIKVLWGRKIGMPGGKLQDSDSDTGLVFEQQLATDRGTQITTNLRLKDTSLPKGLVANTTVTYYLGHPSSKSPLVGDLSVNNAGSIAATVLPHLSFPLVAHILMGKTKNPNLSVAQVTTIMADVNKIWSQVGVGFAVRPIVTDKTTDSLLDVRATTLGPLGFGEAGNVTDINPNGGGAPAIDVYFVNILFDSTSEGPNEDQLNGFTITTFNDQGVPGLEPGVLIGRRLIQPRPRTGGILTSTRTIPQLTRTLAHELGHYLLDTSGHSDEDELWSLMRAGALTPDTSLTERDLDKAQSDIVRNSDVTPTNPDDE